jgi:hypothetical protein
VAGPVVEWQMRASGVKNKLFMTAAGELTSDGYRTRFTGRIESDLQTQLSLLLVAAFGVGGCFAVMAALATLAIASDKAGVPFLLLWGGFGVVFTTVWVRAQAQMVQKHDRILRAVFEEGVLCSPRLVPEARPATRPPSPRSSSAGWMPFEER